MEQKFILVATPGERHEDCTPDGLYSVSVFKSQFKDFFDGGKYKVKYDSFKHVYFSKYIYVMKPDHPYNSEGDCDFVVNPFVEREGDKWDDIALYVNDVKMSKYEFFMMIE